MKTIVSILALCSLALSAFGAEKVEVVSPTVVRVGGQNYGALADTIANNRERAADIQRAAAARWDALLAENAALQARLKAAVAANAALLSKLQAALDNPGALRAAVADAGLTEKAARRAALRAELERKQKELDDLK